MAKQKTGIEYAVFGLRTETTSQGVTTISYTGGKYLSPVAGFNGAPNIANASDYGDNIIQESEDGITGGTLSIEFNHESEDIYTMLLGHEKDSTSGVIIFSSKDEAPYVGAGAIGKSVGGIYVAKFYNKVKFREPNDDNATKAENITFNHITCEGTILIEDDGTWKEQKEFSGTGALASAKSWLNGKVGIS